MNVRPSSGGRHRRGSGSLRALAARRWSRPVGAVAVSGALLATGVTAAYSDPGVVPSAWAHEFLVDSLGTEGDDARGDGVCATASGACTLRAAIEESNTLDAGVDQVRIGVHPDFAGGLIDITGAQATTWMRTTPVSTGGSISGDNGAVFEITAPVTIDLENRLRAAPPTNTATPTAAVFHVNGPNVTLRGIDNSWSGGTTFYVGPQASDVHITGGVVATANNNATRFLVVRGGASNVRLSDYEVSGFASNGTSQGWGFVDGSSADAPVSGLVIERTTYASSASGSCNAASAASCSSAPMSLRNQTVTDFAFRDNTVRNLTRVASAASRLIDFRSATIDEFHFHDNLIESPRAWGSVPFIDFGMTAATAATVGDVVIRSNEFTGVDASLSANSVRYGLIHLPEQKAVNGTVTIADNTFAGAAASAMNAPIVHWFGPRGTASDVTPSGVTIERNSASGLHVQNSLFGPVYQLAGTGAVTLRENTLRSPSSGLSANTVSTETATQAFVSNQNEGANGRAGTWHPTARTAHDVQAAPVPVGCSAELEVAPPASGLTAVPATIDVFWSAVATQAEVYVGSASVTEAGVQAIKVSLPGEGDPRLDGLRPGDPRPIDPETGAVSGFLRLQTQYPTLGEQVVSSQLSRAAQLGGECLLDLSIDQAEEQNDPTLARDLHYTVTSTLTLDPETFTPDAVTVTAEPTEDTIDAERLNPRVVAVTPVEGTEGKAFTVVARVDDSAVVTATIEAGRLTSVDGTVNSSPATSRDNLITFVNPVVLDPARVMLITNSGAAGEYTLSTRAGAPVPEGDLQFTTALDDRGSELGVTLGSPSPVLPAESDTTGTLAVSADAPELEENGMSVLVGHTVASSDTNYDGLVVAPLEVRLFTTNPYLEITKQAFVDVGDPSSPESVLATGTEVPAGSRLGDGQSVCWVYSVTNTSADDWATVLSDVAVRDSDTRLGAGGLIGTLPELGLGATHRLHACAVLIPSDTRAPA